MPSGKPRPHRGAAKPQHIMAMQAQIRRLNSLTIPGWREITHEKTGVPELEQLRAKICELMLEADPMRGRTIGGIGRSNETLSDDGRSTVEGRDTLADRKRLENLQRELKRIVYDLQGGSAKGIGLSKRRCFNDDCPHRGRRQPALYAYCGYCGAAMEEAA